MTNNKYGCFRYFRYVCLYVNLYAKIFIRIVLRNFDAK